ncbi:hypothetical protein CBR_g54826 [Chara braunii]|uniref:CCHC-type domain-containing protein n=1 Tax=Chara braunii TaxID=69332 RepID=A0A388JPM2_CHABU|nr:hypothetical protein CBR_g54826 [Chara braunii]|eukprot:GBG59723.1 hypothetical protein CBR_g54826 [Chara braunii]
MEPELPHEPQGQEQSEDQAAKEKEHDRKERAATEREIRVQIRLKNLAELHEKVEQGEQPVVLEDGKRKGSCAQGDETPLFTEAWDSFDRLLEAARRPREQHQEMGLKLVSTDLLNLKGLMKEGFAAAKASDGKMEKRLTRVARASREQKMDWQKEIDDLKKKGERQDKEVEAMKAEVEKAWADNEAIRHINQTLNKVNDTLRTYLQAPTTVVDWTEVQGFGIRRQPAEEAFKCQKEEEGASQQKGEEIPLLDKETLQPEEIPTKKEAEVDEVEWQMPSILAFEQVQRREDTTQQAETAQDEGAPMITQGEATEVKEAQETTGQVMAEGENLEDCQESTTPQGMPLVTGLEEALGSWATGSGPEARGDEQVTQTDDRTTCPTPSGAPQQEVTSEVTSTSSSAPSQSEGKMSQRKPGKCFYCKKGKHRSEDCPKSLKDEADGLVTREASGRWRDRDGDLVPKTHDGVRAQLYRQLQMVMSDQE